MNFQRACYSYSALQRCADAVKATNWTVRRSAEHFSKCFEVKKVFELCYDETHCKPKRNDTRANLLITGRDVDRQELVLEFDTDKSKWTYLDEERIESQREKDYNKDPIVTTIKDLCAFGPWKGGTADLQAEIEKRTGVQFDVLELGRRIIKLVSPLLEFDNITYSSTKPGNKKVHRFEQEYNT